MRNWLWGLRYTGVVLLLRQFQGQHMRSYTRTTFDVLFRLSLIADDLLGCPIYLSADLCFTGILLSFFFRHVPSELAQRHWNENRPHGRTSVQFENECPKSGVSPYKSGVQNHLFSTTSQLNGKFRGLYLRNETRY